jgi:hypothetical protein
MARMASTPEDGAPDRPAESTRLTFGPPVWAIRGHAGFFACLSSLFIATGVVFFYAFWERDEPRGYPTAFGFIALGAFGILAFLTTRARADRMWIAIDDGTVIVSGPFKASIKPKTIRISDIRKIGCSEDGVWFMLPNYKRFWIDRGQFCDQDEMQQFVEAVRERMAKAELS